MFYIIHKSYKIFCLILPVSMGQRLSRRTLRQNKVANLYSTRKDVLIKSYKGQSGARTQYVLQRGTCPEATL